MQGRIDLAKVWVVGSAEEARAIRLDPARVFTCGPGAPGVLGCPLYDRCKLPQKDRQGAVSWTKDGQPAKWNDEGAERHGPGPMNVGVQRWKRRGAMDFKVINSTCTCWEFHHIRRNHESANMGGDEPVAGCKIIAIEGEKIHLPGSLPTPNEDNKIIHVIQPEGIETRIKPFPRPADNPAFAKAAFAMAELAREYQRTQQSDLREFVRLKPGVTDVGDGDEGDEQPPSPIGGSDRRGASSRG